MTAPVPDNAAPAPAATPAAQRPGLLRRALFPLGMTAATLGVFWMVAGHALSRGDVEQLPPETPRGSSDPKAIAVTVAPVTVRSVQRTVEAVGSLWGYEEVSLKAKVEGRVRRIVHDVSDRVAPGETIVELDPTDADLAVRQAEKSLLTDLARLGLSESPGKDFDVARVPVVAQAKVRLENSKQKYERTLALSKKGVASAEEVSERTTEFRSAEAEVANQILLANAGLATIGMREEALAIARKQRDDTVIRVPLPSQPVPGLEKVSYSLTKRAVSEGSLVRVGDEICRLVIDQTLKLRVAVPERYSGDVQLGQKASVFTSAYVTPFAGQVARINPSVEHSTRTFEVEIVCANLEGKLKPGGFAKAQIATRTDETAATVPLEALVTFAGISKVFVTEGDHVREVRVSLGVQHTDWIEIADPDLPAGAQVVTSGQTALAEGSTIFVRAEVTAKRAEPTRHAN